MLKKRDERLPQVDHIRRSFCCLSVCRHICSVSVMEIASYLIFFRSCKVITHTIAVNLLAANEAVLLQYGQQGHWYEPHTSQMFRMYSGVELTSIIMKFSGKEILASKSYFKNYTAFVLNEWQLHPFFNNFILQKQTSSSYRECRLHECQNVTNCTQNFIFLITFACISD